MVAKELELTSKTAVLSQLPADEWLGCYRDRWKGIISDEAHCHPAKYARGLIERIYEHCLTEGWIGPSARIIDPFGGVGLGALDAMRHGCEWTGIELEAKFQALGTANIQRWQERYGALAGFGSARLINGDSRKLLEVLRGVHDLALTSPPFNENKANQKHGGAKGVFSADGLTRLKKDYIAPHTDGNLGDLAWGGFDAAISSPPFRTANGGGGINVKGFMTTDQQRVSRAAELVGALCASLDTCALPLDAVLDSLRQTVSALRSCSRGGTIPARSDKKGDQGGKSMAALGLHLDDTALLASVDVYAPQWTKLRGSLSDCPSCRRFYDEPLRRVEECAQARVPSLLDALSVLCRVLSESAHSPERQCTRRCVLLLASSCLLLLLTEVHRHFSTYLSRRKDKVGARTYQGADGERGAGNLETLPETGAGFDAAISSPPYAASQGHPSIGSTGKDEWGSDGRDITGRRGLSGSYGETAGQLGEMRDPLAGFDAAITSPPYENSPLTYEKNGLQERPGVKYERAYMDGNTENYGGNAENCANLKGDDFWTASRIILDQLFLALRPGAHACFVTKRFIRKKQIVEFTDQWAQVCVAAGFIPLHWHRCWTLNHHGAQHTLMGEVEEVTSEAKSFFRRLAEKHGSPRIDWEDVTCWLRP